MRLKEPGTQKAGPSTTNLWDQIADVMLLRGSETNCALGVLQKGVEDVERKTGFLLYWTLWWRIILDDSKEAVGFEPYTSVYLTSA